MAIAQTATACVKMDNGSALTGHQRVRGVEWFGADTVADTCVLTDTAGNEFFAKTCAVQYGSEGFTLVELDVTGITATMDSGYALVYMGNGNYQRLT